MRIEKHLPRGAVIELSASNREEAFRELVGALCNTEPELDFDRVMQEIKSRENLISTRIAANIAIPHARMPTLDNALIAVGRSRNGIVYDVLEEEKIHLLVMILGNDRDHLQILSDVVSRLAEPGMQEALIAAETADRIYEILVGPSTMQLESKHEHDTASRTLFRNGLHVAEEIGAAAVMVHLTAEKMPDFIRDAASHFTIIVVTAEDLQDVPESIETLHIPFKGLSTDALIELSLVFAGAKRCIDETDRVVSVLGPRTDGVWDRIVVSGGTGVFQRFLNIDFLGEGTTIEQQVFVKALEVAQRLASEGREGKPVGTIFVLGDSDNVSKHCQQLVANPFKGYDEHERNILDPSIEESVKEFAKIDGAFIIRGDGVILSGGTFIRTSNVSVQLPKGLGSRHMAAASITALTGATAIALSESTRHVSLFRKGRRIVLA